MVPPMSPGPDPPNGDDDFERAVSAHQSGDLPAAEFLYRQILSAAPDDPVVLQLLGNVLAVTGRLDEALTALEQSVAIDAESAEAWAQLALARLRAGSTGSSTEAWIRAWRLDPVPIGHLAPMFAPLLEAEALRRPEFWLIAGENRLASGDAEAAMVDLRHAVAWPASEEAARSTLGGLLLVADDAESAIDVLITGKAADAMSNPRRINLAQALLRNGQPHEAIRTLEGIENQDPVEIRAATTLRVTAYLGLGEIENAEAAVESGLVALPEDPILILLASSIDQRTGRIRNSIDRLRSAVVADETNAELRLRLAELLIEVGDATEALSTLDRASDDAGADPWSLRSLRADALAELGDQEASLQIVRAAVGEKIDSAVLLRLAQTAVVRCHDVELGQRLLRGLLVADPRCLAARRELARTLLKGTLYREAVEILEADPRTGRDPECLSMLWQCRIQLGELPPSADWDSVVASGSAFATDVSDMLLTMQYPNHLDERLVADLHRGWQRCLEGDGGRLQVQAPTRPAEKLRRPLRVGFLSADLRRHAVAFFLSSWLGEVDPRRLRCVALSASQSEDAMSLALKSRFSEWHHVHGYSPMRFRELIDRSGIDILIELGGHTAGSRLDLLHPRSAPVQVSWLGYPNTTGLDSIDFRIVDDFTDPHHQPWFGTERLLHIKAPFLCFGPPTLDLPTVASQGRPTTFGSFNNLQKISDRTVELWASTVRAVPEARLLLKGRGLEDERVRHRLGERFAAAGLERNRLRLLGPDKDLPSHLAQYREVDVALDPFPYHGTTTTCEALWMGVPVVSRIGRTHRSRVGLSLLQSVGLPECCASSDEEFVAIASRLIQSPLGRSMSRDALRQRMESSLLCDPKSFATRFTDVLDLAWKLSISSK